jgi:hypothetical protein
MEFRPPSMHAAFRGRRHLIAWIVMLIAVLISPVVTTLVVGPNTRYLVMSKRTGPSDWHAKQLTAEWEPLDIVFMGNSRIETAVDHDALQRVMALRGENIRSATIAVDWDGYDLVYTFLSDFFVRRRARLVVVHYPEFSQAGAHPAQKYVRKLWPADPGLDPRSAAFSTTNYGEMALIGMRLVLAALIPPRAIDLAAYRSMEDFHLDAARGSHLLRRGYSADRTLPYAPFVRSVVPGNPPGAELINPDAPLPEDVIVTDAPLSPIESAYLPALKALCEKNGAELVIMRLPLASAPDRKVVEVSRAVLSLGVPIMVASLNRMFGDVPELRIQEQYYDARHFNFNGMQQSADAYAPALQTLLDKRKGL